LFGFLENKRIRERAKLGISIHGEYKTITYKAATVSEMRNLDLIGLGIGIHFKAFLSNENQSELSISLEWLPLTLNNPFDKTTFKFYEKSAAFRIAIALGIVTWGFTIETRNYFNHDSLYQSLTGSAFLGLRFALANKNTARN
jgi:hypothetical protein